MEAFAGTSVAMFFIGLYLFVGIILLTDDRNWDRRNKK